MGFAFVLASTATANASGQPASTQLMVKTISAKALTDHECDDTEWHFVITQIDDEANAPASIHVTWANGEEADVPLGNFTGGVAHYTTTENLDSTVTSATAEIYEAWDGQFNLSHGPCGTPSTTPPTTETTTKTATETKTATSTETATATTTAPGQTETATSTETATAPGATSTETVGAPPVATSQPFVPGPGQTNDTPPSNGFPVKEVLLGSGLGMLLLSLTLFARTLRQRGNHS